MESTRVELVMRPDRIAWLKFLLESYEGVALPMTLDAKSGRVALLAGAGSERELAELLEAVSGELGLVPGLSDDWVAVLTGGSRPEGKVGQ